MAATSPLECAAADLPCERYGLQLVDPSETGDCQSEVPAQERPLRPFDWGLLASFAAIEVAHLAGLALLARWALRRLFGA